MIDILEVFEYNQHFVAMMNIINSARLCNNKVGHKHHIIPRSWFKWKGLTVDNSEFNLILLTEEQHLLVHKLAALCIKDDIMISNMKRSIHMLHGGSMVGIHHTEESKRKMSESHKGQIAWNKGLHWSDATKKKISEASKGRVPPNKGKKASKELRRKLSEAAKNSESKIAHCRKYAGNRKGTHWKLVNGKRVYYGSSV